MNVKITGPGSRDPERIAELTPQASENVMGQHIVSKVLLREWAAAVKHTTIEHVQPYDLQHPKRRLNTRPPRGIGKIENFVPWASTSLEIKWGLVERELPDALAAVKAGIALGQPRTAGILRDLIALHYIRSHHYREAFNRVFTEFLPRQREWLLTERADQLEAAYLQHTGRPAAGPEDLAAIADEIFSLMLDQFHDGSLLRVRIEASFDQARQLMAQYSLEILETEEGEFLIGDNPALTVRKEGDSLSHGMALLDSHTTVLPIGPHHMLALGPTPFYGRLAKSAVDKMNVLQIKAAREYVYTRPNSYLAAIVREEATSRSPRL
ncbi:MULTISPECIES: DUF4238 domain-containing protein [Streptomyces]|nr:DUF4238 domain-containing protein [Streptomyces ruber]